MANRSDLAVRVGAVLDERQRRGRAGRFMVAFGCAVAAVVVFTISPLATVSSLQSATAYAATPNLKATGKPSPSFEVVSIKPSRSDEMGSVIMAHPGRFTGIAVTPKLLVYYAYHVREFQVVGGPGWVTSARYNFEAKEDDATVNELGKHPLSQRLGEEERLFQSLLADRFKLTVHHEARDLPVYALVVAKNGPKFRQAKPGDTYPNGVKGPDGKPFPMGPDDKPIPLLIWREGDQIKMSAQGAPIASADPNERSLLGILSSHVGREVVDRTGLPGKYDFTLQWTPDEVETAIIARNTGQPVPDTASPPESSGPSIFKAVQEQLGLKLVPTKGPVDVIVIDHIERPTAN